MALKLKFRPIFPALVSAASPLTLVKTGLSYAFGLDATALRASFDAIYQVTITSGDVTVNASGVTAIGAIKVTSAMLNADVFSTAHSWAGQQTFVAPVLGTPASGTLTNTTGFPLANLAGAASGILTLLATPSSANLRAALTDETGTGAAVFATSPALSTPTGIVASDIGNNGMLAVKATAVNFNSANTDTSIAIPLPTGYTRYQILRVLISHLTGTSLTTSTFGVFTAAAAGGTAIVASGTANTVSSAAENTANNIMSATVAVGATGGTTSLNVTPLFFRVQTAQGTAATGDVTFIYHPVS